MPKKPLEPDEPKPVPQPESFPQEGIDDPTPDDPDDSGGDRPIKPPHTP